MTPSYLTTIFFLLLFALIIKNPMPSASGCWSVVLCVYNVLHHPDNSVISRRSQFFICWAVVVVTRHHDSCFNTTGRVMWLADIYLLWQSPALFTLCFVFLLLMSAARSWGVHHDRPSWKHLGLVISCNINHAFWPWCSFSFLPYIVVLFSAIRHLTLTTCCTHAYTHLHYWLTNTSSP